MSVKKDIVTLNDLKKVVDSYVELGKGNYQIKLVTKEESIGPLPGTNIKYIYSGIDWDKDTILIYPKEDLIKKK